MFTKILFTILGIQTALAPTAPYYDSKPAKPSIATVREEIIKQAAAADFPVSTALAIAECESNFDPFVQNTASSAKGVYQFTIGTFDAYCTGDRSDYQDNIACFIKLYPIHPEWWECQP